MVPYPKQNIQGILKNNFERILFKIYFEKNNKEINMNLFVFIFILFIFFFIVEHSSDSMHMR